MILLVKYIDFNLWSIDPVDYDLLETEEQEYIQLYGYSHSNTSYNGVLKSKLYADTDHMATIEITFEEEYKDIKQWLKLYNRSETIKKILNNAII